VSIDGVYSCKIFDADLSAVPGNLYTMALSWPWVTCHDYNLTIMDEFSGWLSDCDFITILVLKVRFHLIRMSLQHGMFTAFRTKFCL
jgi:hypothetical protein